MGRPICALCGVLPRLVALPLSRLFFSDEVKTMIAAAVRARLLSALALGLLVCSPVAQAAKISIKLQNGQSYTVDLPFNLTDIQSIQFIGNAAGTVSPPLVSPPTAQVSRWAGVWRTDDSSIGKMTLTQSGNVVTGTYEHADGRVKGTLNGNVFTGEWIQNNGSGPFGLVLSADGRTLQGWWSYAGSPDSKHPFRATRE